jgi:RES domain-containing protein
VITSWRIVKAKHAPNAFDGHGARSAGGRWNSPGVAMVYTAQSAALAALEILVHVNSGPLLSSYVLIPCAFDTRLILQLDRTHLPARWREHPAVPPLQLLGDAWIKNALSAVMAVPSAVIAMESNYLLNPAHPDFGAIEIGAPQPFDFDARLVRDAGSSR